MADMMEHNSRMMIEANRNIATALRKHLELHKKLKIKADIALSAGEIAGIADCLENDAKIIERCAKSMDLAMAALAARAAVEKTNRKKAHWFSW